MEKYNILKELLEDSTCAHLADCLEMIPVANLDALLELVVHHRRSNTQRAIYRYQVIQDVAALLEGHINNPLFSQPFLAQAGSGGVCDLCANDFEKLEKVSIPNTDLRYLCTDCLKLQPLNGVVDYRECTPGTL